MDLKLRKRANLNNKTIIIGIAFFLLTSLSLGFAYLESRIKINGSVSVVNNVWDVHFENLVVDSGSVSASSPATISSDRRKITFSLNFTDLEQYYQFSVDVVNKGTMDAMIGDISLSGIPDSLKDYLEYSLFYVDDSPVNKSDALKAGGSSKIKVRVNFKNGVEVSSRVQDSFTLTLEISYVQSTEEAKDRKPQFFIQQLGLDKNAKSDSGIDFTLHSSENNGRGLYIYSGTENNEYPIYYYRGAVTNNNVIFAGFCWKIVRTTETGGTKILYNGTVGANNTCSNTTGDDTMVGKSEFNTSRYDPKYLGYMYDVNSSSSIKKYIDEWYEFNFLGKYSNYLEDTIWCVDRSDSQIAETYYRAYGFAVRSNVKKEKPIVTCPLKEDSYTTITGDNSNGNKLLDYPIALLTGDEAQLAGIGFEGNNGTTDPYIYNNKDYWLLSPALYGGNGFNYAYVYHMHYIGGFSSYVSDGVKGVRPVISLKLGTTYTTSGMGEAGSSTNPYVVVYKY